MADLLCVQMVMEGSSRLASPLGVPMDVPLTYHPFTPTWLSTTTGSARTVADVCNLITEGHFSSGSKKIIGLGHEILNL